MSNLPQTRASERLRFRLSVAWLIWICACSDRLIVDAAEPLDAFDRDDVALVCNNQCELSFCGGDYRDFEGCYDACVRQEGLDAWKVVQSECFSVDDGCVEVTASVPRDD